jgi:hypothetical protein
MKTESPIEPPRRAPGAGLRLAFVLGVALVTWFAAGELFTHFWYASHEARLPKNRPLPDGAVLVKRIDDLARSSGAQPKEQEIGAAAMEILKCSFGKMVIWAGENGPMAATVLKWSDQSTVGGVENLHNPGACLQAAGWAIGAKTEFGTEDYCGAEAEVIGWDVSRPGLKMRAFSAIFRRFPMQRRSAFGSFWNNDRLESVLAGRRDAPLLIVLGYVPITTSADDAHVRFQQVLHAALCGDSLPRP